MSNSDPSQGDKAAAPGIDMPPGPAPKPRTRARRQTAAELARLIAREQVEVQPSGLEDAATRTGTRLELLLRCLLDLASGGDVKAARCFLEYMEGKPPQIVQATVKQAGAARPLSADEMAALMAAGMAKVEKWEQEATGARQSPGASSTRSG